MDWLLFQMLLTKQDIWGKKKSDLTNATKREKGFICPLILAEMWSTDYTIFLIKKIKLLTELFCFPVVC